MSDEMYDADELAELYEDPDQLTPEEVFAMVTLNRVKKCKVHVELRDENGDTVSLPNTISSLLDYINDKMKVDGHESNQFVDQIFPLMSQSIVSGLGRMLGIHQTAFMITNDATKTGILYMMCVAFLLLKFVQNNNLKIHTYEEPISDEELESIERKAEANKAITMGAMAGMEPQEILKQLYDKGAITEDDMNSLMGKSKKVI